jgi:hypothetical protein
MSRYGCETVVMTRTLAPSLIVLLSRIDICNYNRNEAEWMKEKLQPLILQQQEKLFDAQKLDLWKDLDENLAQNILYVLKFIYVSAFVSSDTLSWCYRE